MEGPPENTRFLNVLILDCPVSKLEEQIYSVYKVLSLW